jgi:hypothetical protein
MSCINHTYLTYLVAARAFTEIFTAYVTPCIRFFRINLVFIQPAERAVGTNPFITEFGFNRGHGEGVI